MKLPFRIPHFGFRNRAGTLRTLDRYLVGEWFRVFLITLFGFPILVIVIDLTDRLDHYLGLGLKTAAIALSYVFYVPELMFLILPVAVLFATVFTVGALGRHSELTAAKASGISFHRLVRPLFLAGATAFIAGLLLGEIAPVTTARRLELTGEKAVRATTSRYNFVYRADSGWVYAIRALELKQGQMMDLMLEREGSSADYPTIILAAERANYREPGRLRKGVKPSRWTLHRGTIRYLAGTEPTGEYSFEFDTLHSRTLNEKPVDLLAEPKAPDEMRYGELRSYIDALIRSGSNAKKLQVELALKIAIPFISLLIALFGAPLAISSPKSGMAWGVAASLATTFIVLLMFQLAKAVGAGGVLPPAVAAWMPNILVGAAAFYLLKKAPT